MTAPLKSCAACGEPLPAGSHASRKFCAERCDHRKRPAPAVYRYVAPDGRCYVGSVSDIRTRDRRGLSRSNSWIDEAPQKFPAKLWRFEVLKKLPPGCSERSLRRAEQFYIERLRSWEPAYGFNCGPAVWFGNTPGILAAWARRAEQTRRMHIRNQLADAAWWESRRIAAPVRREEVTAT